MYSSEPIGARLAEALASYLFRRRRITLRFQPGPNRQPPLKVMQSSATHTSRSADVCCLSRARVPAGVLS